MTGETKQVYAINAKTPTSKENDTALEHFSKKDAAGDPSRVSNNSESALIADKASQLNGRERETCSQREAVIRPQQAGKIDFKSLQNRPKYSSDATWTNGKSSPLSPTGKSKGKDKNKRSGKGDRSQHQLYRLSLNSARSNPTIGIAYPQQKVTQPKKVEVNHGPVSGSYRFHVPSLPEREAELHQEDLNFSRSLPEPSPNLTSTNYTSQTAPANRTHHSLKLQPGNLHDNSNSNGQLHYLEFQPNGNKWHLSEKLFAGTSGYSILNQKLCPYPEGNKSDSHGFGPLPFQYPFQEANGNSFCNNGNSQDFVDVSLAASQVAHNSFSFQSSSREGPEDPQGNGSYNTVLSDSRSYGLPSQQSPFLHTQQGVQHSPTPPCYTGRNEHSAEHNGAISSSGALTPSGAIEQTQSTFQEKQTVFNPSEFSLHNNSVPALICKRQQTAKDFVHSQRLLAPGNTLRRNIPHTSLNKVHFPNKPYNNVNTGSVPFDKSLSRIPKTWDTGSNDFPPLDQNSLSYPNASGNSIPYQCQPSDPRQALKNQRMPWQQVHLTSPTANQNHIELSRHNGNQKLPYNLGNSDWQNNTMMPKILPSYHAKQHIVVDGSSTQRPEISRQSYSSSNDMLYDSVKDTNSQINDSRTKGILYGINQPIPQSRNNSNQSVPLSGKTFVAESPCESPLPSPVTNPVTGSTCSSLSPMSSSPVNPSSEESQVQPTLTSSPYFHQPCHQTDKSFHPNDPLNSGSFLYHKAELTKHFPFLLDSSKDEQTFKNLQENQYQKLANEPSKGCLESFESEPPPPYSSHHFLGSSLSSVNLDQLDVLLTCKQCDQNFGNLSSFLEHRQYCHLNSNLQNEMKDSLHGGEIRKSAASQISDLSHHKGQMEFHSQLAAFNKDYLLDCDAKGEPKEDPLKSSTFHNGAAHLLPMSACETLEMDDAKLDSLIIEALNGLEFQVDNPEIDSTFIDVFVDDDITSSKSTACSQPHKVKESTDTRKNAITEEKNSNHNQVQYACEENCDDFEKEASYNHGTSIKVRNVSKSTEIETAHHYSVDNETTTIKHVTAIRSEDSDQQTRGDMKTFFPSQEKKKIDLNKNIFDVAEDKVIKPFDFKQGKNDPKDFSIIDTPKPRRTTLTDVKKKKPHNGTWSKELIHKIVQQKNKLHKLHVKSNKNVQFSLVTERLFPPTKNHPFGEYDYISDSDEDVAANLLPSKMQPNGRLKYSFNRDLQGRIGRQKLKEPVWRMGEATRFQIQSKDLRSTNKDTSTRIRRRSSQSSNSSDQSTSMSSEAGSSPKSTERTDSENEHESALRCKTFNARGQNTLERNPIKPLYRENMSDNQIHSTDYSKGTKRFGSAKFLLAGSKVYPSTMNAETHYQEKDTLQQSTDPTVHNSSKITEAHSFEEGRQTKLSTYQDTMAASTLAQDNYTSNLILTINNVRQELSTFHSENIDYQKKQLNSSSSIPEMLNTEGNPTCSDNNVKSLSEELCYGHKDFTLPMSCFNGDSTVNILPQQNQKEFGNECQQFPEDKHEDMPSLYTNNIFAKTQIPADLDVEQIYANQTNVSNINSFEQKCQDIPSYPDKVSSSFSFDSSSIFAELPISDFESTMYNSITPPKDTYMEFNQPSKPSPFENPFTQYLPEKSWNLIEEGAPILSAHISPFQGNDNQAAEKYAEHLPVPSERMSEDLSRDNIDYGASYINNVQAEDELEIKRLVTELENQLQTSKDHKEVSSQTSPKHPFPPELTDSSLPFPEMELNQIESSRNHSYLNDNHNNLSNVHSLVPPTKVDCNILDSHPLVKDNTTENLKSPWDCSVQFDTFSSSIECHKPTRSLDSFTSPEDSNQYQSGASDICLTDEIGSLNHGSPSVMSGVYLPNLSNQMECQTFSDHELLRDTLATAETLLSKSQENDIPEKENQQNDNENLIIKLQKLDEQFDDPPELEHFQSISDSDSEFGLKNDNAPELNVTVMPDHNDSTTEPNLCDPVVKLSIPQTAINMEHINDHVILGDKEASDKHGYKDNKQSVLLDMPVLVKEESTIPEKSSTTQEATENPLQQLQLFVARTAKNNEEEMLMPCFPVILAASVTAENKSEAERDASYMLESSESFTAESENNQKMTEMKEAMQLSESGIQISQIDEVNMLGHKDSISGTLAEPIINEVPSEDEQINHLDNECPNLNVINIGVEGVKTHQNNLLPESRDTGNLQQLQVKEIYGGNDGKRLSSFAMKTKKVSRSRHKSDKEKYTSDSINTPKVLSAQQTICDRPDVRCLAPGPLNEVAQMSKDKNNQELNKEIPGFVCLSSHMQDINMLEETELFLVDNKTQDHSSTLSKGNCHVSDIAEKSSHFALQPSICDVQQNSSNEYEDQLHSLGLPSEQPLLNFDLLTVEPIKDPIAQQNLLYTSQKELNSNEKDALCSSNQAFPSVAMSPSEQLPEKSPVESTHMQLFLSDERIMSSSTEASQQELTAKDPITMTPVVEDGLSPCFCSELVCPHFKHRQVQSVADIILGCQSLATEDTYPPIYAGENHQNFSVLHNELFSESMQNTVAPLLCNHKEESPSNDWNKSRDMPNIDHAYQNEDKSSTMVSDLMHIAAPEYVNFNCHQTTENTAGRSVPEKNYVSETQNGLSNTESEKKGTNDMDSVIDGVLRILEGDKSKEILQSIGITTKSSPIKEKKLSGLSLTCDICLVSFRSKPGLTRHKAVKHSSSLMSPKDATGDTILGEWKCNGESQQKLQTDTTSQHRSSKFPNQSNSFQPDEEPPKTKGDKGINGRPENKSCIDITCKKKMNVKVKKRKVKPQNNTCAESQVPPDDVLNILKTNILKAIGQSNSFNSTEDKTEWQEPLDKNMEGRKQTDLKEVKLKMCVPVCTDDDDEKLVSDVLDMEMNREALIQEQTWAENIKGHVEHIIDDCENQPINNLMNNDQNLLSGAQEQLNTLEHSNINNDVQDSNVSKETVSDLHSLFDDDNSFSQLFPRDDHFIRRKCTRVYGKRSKRQTPPFETDFRQEEKSEHCHSSQMHYTCDYRTSPADSSSMVRRNSSGQTEQLAQYNQPSPLEEGMDVDTKMLSFVHQSKPENLNEESFAESLPLEQDSDMSIHENPFKPPKVSDLSSEMGPEIRESEVEENLDCKTNNESGLPEFPTIDMKMLSAKFDMRELSFFTACGDDSDQCDSDATDVTQKAERRKRHAKSKTDEKKRSKNRNNVKIKNKDKQYKCKVCFQWFLTLGELDFHKLTHNPSPPPTCYMCVQRKFSSREQLRDHLKEKHAKNKAGLWICGMCLKEISDVWMYNEHLREHATQFARKGQAQKSVMGIPGCFGEESMVRTFLSTFIYRTPTKSSKNLETDEKSPVAKRQESKEHKEEDEVVVEKEAESTALVVPPAPKLSVSSSLESSQKSDTIHKNASMHPHCKDPSRDCHHCGKQFPKPFKLQRHLVVHSLQKIFLCHRCPKSYQEVQELRSHLTIEHQLTEKSEIKHTTLYACELCADVMHVIKKSFICSTCNYTFSKKEQYDRHMEKHLIGGSMTFKFRGVMRPTTSGKEAKEKVKDSPEYECIPPSKRPKLSNYSDISTDVPNVNEPPQCLMLSPGVYFEHESGESPANEHENSVKIEEMLLEAPELHAEGKEEPITFNAELGRLSPVPYKLNVPVKRDDENVRQALPILNDDTAFSSAICAAKKLTFPINNGQNSKVTEAETKEQAKQKELVEMEGQPDIQTLQVKADNDISNLMLQEPELYTFNKEMPSSGDTSKVPECLLPGVTEEPKEYTQKSLSQDVAQPTVTNTPKDKSLVTDTNALAKDQKFTKKNKSVNQLNTISPTQTNADNVFKSSTTKSKAACHQDGSTSTLKEVTTSQQKLTKKETTVISSKNTTDFKVADKMLASTASKSHPKRCKEQKISGHKGNAGSQENLDGEVKKKRTKLAMTGKSESSAVAKKTDWVNSLSDAKDEAPCNRVYHKLNSGGVPGQFKKTVLDTHNQKKVNAASSNGDYKSKRALLTKSLHTFTPKSSPLSMNGTPHKRRLGANTKPTEPPNYRTAESQNNLLSQLFGQKITSFKIPLRRDLTE